MGGWGEVYPSFFFNLFNFVKPLNHNLVIRSPYVVMTLCELLSRPQTINLYDIFVCHDDDDVVAASTSDYRLGRSD